MVSASPFLLILLWASPAWGHEIGPCLDRADYLAGLADNYAESPVAMGMTPGGLVLEVITSESGSWTIIITLPNGASCGFASGEDWQEVVAVRGEPT